MTVKCKWEFLPNLIDSLSILIDPPSARSSQLKQRLIRLNSSKDFFIIFDGQSKKDEKEFCRRTKMAGHAS
jgi:hypothetical protein